MKADGPRLDGAATSATDRAWMAQPPQRGWSADGQTGELLNVDDDSDSNERAAVHLVVATKHKLKKLLWLPLTYKKVAAFFSGIGGFDMGLKKAQDLVLFATL